MWVYVSFGRTFKNLLLKKTKKKPTKYYPDFESDYICICVFVSVNAQESLIRYIPNSWQLPGIEKSSQKISHSLFYNEHHLFQNHRHHTSKVHDK